MRLKKTAIAGVLLLGTIAGSGAAAAATCTVTGQDTMWSIAKQRGIPFTTLLQMNPQVSNKNNIWPGMKLNIPNTTAPTAPGAPTGSGSQPADKASYAGQVVTLVNQERAKAGLKL